MRLILRRIIGIFSRLAEQNVVACPRCWISLLHTRPHGVPYEEKADSARGVICMCEKCWANSTKDERVEYHFKRFSNNPHWDQIKKAITED